MDRLGAKLVLGSTVIILHFPDLPDTNSSFPTILESSCFSGLQSTFSNVPSGLDEGDSALSMG